MIVVVYAGCKGTKFLANHNTIVCIFVQAVVVYAGCKGTKFLANHNRIWSDLIIMKLFMLGAKVLNF